MAPSAFCKHWCIHTRAEVGMCHWRHWNHGGCDSSVPLSWARQTHVDRGTYNLRCLLYVKIVIGVQTLPNDIGMDRLIEYIVLENT